MPFHRLLRTRFLPLLIAGWIVLAGCLATSTAATPVPTSTPEQEPTNTPSPVAGRPPVLAAAVTYSLVVRELAEIPAYDRNDWRLWIDEDRDCQDARAEVLIAESLVPVTFDGCRVVSGKWIGLYTGTVVTNASDLDIDHMVPLSNANRSGGWAWDAAKKRAYANDLTEPDHLIAVTASANRSKGDRGPEDWRPPDVTYWCEYASDWARIKDTWDLTVTHAEFDALTEMFSSCDMRVALIITDAGGIEPLAVPEPSGLLYDPFGPDRNCGDFSSAAEANAFFKAAGGPAKDPHRLDADHDGIPCESLR